MAWVLLVLAYGLIKGIREVLKKKALEKSSLIEVLFLYTFLSFLIVTPEVRNAGGVPGKLMIMIVVKSFAIFLAWLCGFKAISNMPVSLYGVIDLSRVIFSTVLGIVLVHETVTASGWIGFVLVIAGLLMLKLRKGSDNSKEVEGKYVILSLISCALNGFSGVLDKIIMSTNDIYDGQLQFWYMLFLVFFYLIYIVLTKQQIRWKSALKNYWIWILAVAFVIADRCLFIANGIEGSRVTVMTLIKQSSVIVTILLGKLIFKEKNIGYKLICALVVLSGILISVLL